MLEVPRHPVEARDDLCWNWRPWAVAGRSPAAILDPREHQIGAAVRAMPLEQAVTAAFVAEQDEAGAVRVIRSFFSALIIAVASFRADLIAGAARYPSQRFSAISFRQILGTLTARQGFAARLPLMASLELVRGAVMRSVACRHVVGNGEAANCPCGKFHEPRWPAMRMAGQRAFLAIVSDRAADGVVDE